MRFLPPALALGTGHWSVKERTARHFVPLTSKLFRSDAAKKSAFLKKSLPHRFCFSGVLACGFPPGGGRARCTRLRSIRNVVRNQHRQVGLSAIDFKPPIRAMPSAPMRRTVEPFDEMAPSLHAECRPYPQKRTCGEAAQRVRFVHKQTLPSSVLPWAQQRSSNSFAPRSLSGGLRLDTPLHP
jgi:hypothetical protein